MRSSSHPARNRPTPFTTFAVLALSGGLLHCSSEPAAPDALTSIGGATAAGAAGVGGTAEGGRAQGGASGSPTAGAPGHGGTGLDTGGTGGAPSASAGFAGSLGHSGGGADAAGGGATACGTGAMICEDFEDYPTANPPTGGWTPSLRGNGKIVVDGTRAFSGKQSLRVTGKMNADRANISRPIQTESPAAYVKFMYYGIGYPASSGVHTRLMRIGTSQAAGGSPDSSYSLASYNGTAIEKVNSIYLRDTSTKLNDPKLLNRWTCLEFAIDRSGGVGKVKVQLWVDGRELALSPAGSSSHGMTSSSWDPIPFELFMVGLDGFQADTQAADFWIDDLSVTPERVGCRASLP